MMKTKMLYCTQEFVDLCKRVPNPIWLEWSFKLEILREIQMGEVLRLKGETSDYQMDNRSRMDFTELDRISSLDVDAYKFSRFFIPRKWSKVHFDFLYQPDANTLVACHISRESNFLCAEDTMLHQYIDILGVNTVRIFYVCDECNFEDFILPNTDYGREGIVAEKYRYIGNE